MNTNYLFYDIKSNKWRNITVINNYLYSENNPYLIFKDFK